MHTKCLDLIESLSHRMRNEYGWQSSNYLIKLRKMKYPEWIAEQSNITHSHRHTHTFRNIGLSWMFGTMKIRFVYTLHVWYLIGVVGSFLGEFFFLLINNLGTQFTDPVMEINIFMNISFLDTYFFSSVPAHFRRNPEILSIREFEICAWLSFPKINYNNNLRFNVWP